VKQLPSQTPQKQYELDDDDLLAASGDKPASNKPNRKNHTNNVVTSKRKGAFKFTRCNNKPPRRVIQKRVLYLIE
jgi:hypothetical protein